MNQKPPDYLMAFFSILLMLMVALVGCLIIGCSFSYQREADTINGKTTAATEIHVSAGKL